MAIFDSGQLHPEATASFDRAADELRALFSEELPRPLREQPFDSRLDIPTVVSSWVDPVSARTDFALRTTGWAFRSGSQDYVLQGEGYRSLRHLVERIRGNRAFRTGFSDHFLEKTVVDWCLRKKTDEVASPFTEHLIERCTVSLTDHVLLVPLANIEIEHDFALGDVRIVTMAPGLFSKAREYRRVRRPDDPKAGQPIDLVEQRYANRAAVEIKVSGEVRYARDHAMALAHEVAAVLRFCSPSTVSSTVPSPIQPDGAAPLPQTMLFHRRDERITHVERSMLHAGLADWKLTKHEIGRLTVAPLANIHVLFDGREDTAFAAHVRGPFFAYCRALGRFEPAERLVETIGALEALLLRNDVEQLQAAVADRLAFLVSSSLEGRLRVVSDYRRAYRLRSRALHHLRGIDDEETADRLFLHAFIAFHKAIEGLSIFTHPQELFDTIDHIKFSGSATAVSDKQEDETVTEG